MYINTSPASPASSEPNKCIYSYIHAYVHAHIRCRTSAYKYFSGAGKVFLNTSQASPAPETYQISNTSSASEKYLYTLIWRRRGRRSRRIRRSIYIHRFRSRVTASIVTCLNRSVLVWSESLGRGHTAVGCSRSMPASNSDKLKKYITAMFDIAWPRVTLYDIVSHCVALHDTA